MEALSKEAKERLRAVSTATLSTLLFKRGLRNTWLHGVQRMSAAKANMVGEAFTLRNIPCREDLDQVSVFENPEHPQRKAFDTTPAGSVLVIDCRGDTRAASGGGILTTRLKVRGATGLVSDGCLRDSDEIARMDFPGVLRRSGGAAEPGPSPCGRVQRADRLRRCRGVSGRCRGGRRRRGRHRPAASGRGGFARGRRDGAVRTLRHR